MNVESTISFRGNVSTEPSSFKGSNLQTAKGMPVRLTPFPITDRQIRASIGRGVGIRNNELVWLGVYTWDDELKSLCA